jgi:hypothetical protein
LREVRTISVDLKLAVSVGVEVAHADDALARRLAVLFGRHQGLTTAQTEGQRCRGETKRPSSETKSEKK